MDHKLQVLVKLNIDSTSAVLDVGGCLTRGSCQALFPIIRRTASLAHGLEVTVDLSAVDHIDEDGLWLLRDFGAGKFMDSTSPDGRGFGGVRDIVVPEHLPECEALRARNPGVEPAAA
ncbi:MAG TPA: hypothetical protein VN621_11835 [Arthrobacter sp.]|nr:hypothetical protein [Arthrobacter sp.]